MVCVRVAEKHQIGARWLFPKIFDRMGIENHPGSLTGNQFKVGLPVPSYAWFRGHTHAESKKK
jgi:hypothetical protein